MRAARAAGAAALLGCAQGAPAAPGPRLCRYRRGVREQQPRLRSEHPQRCQSGSRWRGAMRGGQCASGMRGGRRRAIGAMSAAPSSAASGSAREARSVLLTCGAVFERSSRSERSELRRTTPRRAAQGSRCEAPTAAVIAPIARRRPPRIPEAHCPPRIAPRHRLTRRSPATNHEARSASARSSTRATCSALRFAPSAIWCLQLVPSATTISPGPAARTAGNNAASPIFIEMSWCSAS